MINASVLVSLRTVSSIFMKSCRILDYWYGKNPLNIGVTPTENGLVAAILCFPCYYSLSSAMQNHLSLSVIFQFRVLFPISIYSVWLISVSILFQLF